jgi:hypothetical protein
MTRICQPLHSFSPMPPAPRAERISYGPNRMPGVRATVVDYTGRTTARTGLLLSDGQWRSILPLARETGFLALNRSDHSPLRDYPRVIPNATSHNLPRCETIRLPEDVHHAGSSPVYDRSPG